MLIGLPCDLTRRVGVPMSQILPKPLTSIQTKRYDSGRQGARCIVERQNGEQPKSSTILASN